MSKGYKSYDAKLKARIALESMKGDISLVQLCADNKISKTSVIEWRDKLTQEAETIFVPSHEKQKLLNNARKEIETLHKVIGEITVENNFLKKKLLQ
jgi:transposase